VRAPPGRLKLHDRLAEIEQRMWQQEAHEVDVVVASAVGIEDGQRQTIDFTGGHGTDAGSGAAAAAFEGGESDDEENGFGVTGESIEVSAARLGISVGLGAALAGGGGGGPVQAAIGGSGRLLCTHLAMFPPLELSRVRLLSADSTKKASVERSLKHLDQSPSRESLKIGVLYVGEGQTKEAQILQNSSRNRSALQGGLHEEYEEFVSGLGWDVDLTKHRGFAGGLDKNAKSLAQGRYTVYHANSQREVVYHVASRMPTKANDPQQINKKRHVGNDFVHIVWNEHVGRE
jgi:hypothetical protein